MESMQERAGGISVKEKQRGHKKGQGRKAEQTKFNGFSIAEVLKLGKKQPHLLTKKEGQALELYWDARLALMGESVGRGANHDWLTYEADIVVLDFFAEDKTYEIPQNNGERIGKPE